jgi:hypothetical protein
MKSMFFVVTSAIFALASTASHAQSTIPVSRAQIKSEIRKLEQVGFNPSSRTRDYPADIQYAEYLVEKHENASAYGAVSDCNSQSGEK